MFIINDFYIKPALIKIKCSTTGRDRSRYHEIPEVNSAHMSVFTLWRHTRPAATGFVISPTCLLNTNH
jgi:hypothetical protein